MSRHHIAIEAVNLKQRNFKCLLQSLHRRHHLNSSHGDGSTFSHCPFCKNTFTTSRRVLEHTAKFHEEQIQSSKENCVWMKISKNKWTIAGKFYYKKSLKQQLKEMSSSQKPINPLLSSLKSLESQQVQSINPLQAVTTCSSQPDFFPLKLFFSCNISEL